MRDEDVLGLEISMDDAEAVDVNQAFEDLAEDAPQLGAVLVELPSNQIAKRLLRRLAHVPKDFSQVTREILTRFSQYSIEM